MTLAELQQQQAEWAKRNFAKTIDNREHPLLGIIEELGELAHAHLKCEQGIRGTRDDHHEAKVDAIGDIMIYLADHCSRNYINLSATCNGRTLQSIQDEYRGEAFNGATVLLNIAMEVGNIADEQCGGWREPHERAINELVHDLATYCACYGISFADTVADTWDKVRRRDWNENPNNGDES